MEYKRKFGDKKDGRLITGKELDTNHFVMPLVWPRRTDNEAFISEIIDLTEVEKYLEKKNKNADNGTTTVFMVIAAAAAKLFLNRPKMNRFYRNGRLYERYDVSIGFIVKKSLNDNSDEALARIIVDPKDTFDTFVTKVKEQINFSRGEIMDKSSDDLRVLMKFPHFVGKTVMNVMKAIDKKTYMPESISESDMFFKSIVISHLGSIGLHAGYHHLSNWGTNSFFMTIGQKQIRPFYDKDGSLSMKPSIDIGMTIDERIADGLYFARSIRLFKKYIENPELLDDQFKEQ